MPGGGALGSYQVGVLRALTEAGITADLLIGVSAGSVNAACSPGTVGSMACCGWKRSGVASGAAI